MTNSLKYFIPAGIVLFALALFVTIASGAVTFSVPNKVNQTDLVPLLTATSTIGQATSTNITGGGGYAVIAGARRVALYFSRSATSTNNGSSLFSVQVSPDGSTWLDYSTLEQNSATTTYPAVIASVSIPSGTSTVVTYMRYLGPYAVRCIATITQDGANTCKVQVTY